MYELRIEGGGNNNWNVNNSQPAKKKTAANTFNMADALKQLNKTPEDKLQARIEDLLRKESPDGKIRSVSIDTAAGVQDINIREKEEKLISPDSELGKQITARREELWQKSGGCSITQPVRLYPTKEENELDAYEPVYAPSAYDNLGKFDPNYKPKLIGYRRMTEEEKSGHINY